MRISTFAICFAFACASFNTTHAQAGTATVRGTIVERETGQPIGFALVRLVEAHRSDQSHANGTFRFADVHAGTYTVTVRRIGYSAQDLTLTLRSGQDTTLRITMDAAAIVLSPTIVTGTVGEKRLRR